MITGLVAWHRDYSSGALPVLPVNQDGRIGSEFVMKQHVREILLGIVFAALGIGFALFLDDTRKLDFFALQLIFIAGIYLGFALVDRRPKYLVIEIGGILMFSGLTLLGLWVAPIFLAIGYFAHGVWDLLHHSRIQTRIVDWWPPFCVVVDWIIAVYIVIWILRM